MLYEIAPDEEYLDMAERAMGAGKSSKGMLEAGQLMPVLRDINVN